MLNGGLGPAPLISRRELLNVFPAQSMLPCGTHGLPGIRWRGPWRARGSVCVRRRQHICRVVSVTSMDASSLVHSVVAPYCVNSMEEELVTREVSLAYQYLQGAGLLPISTTHPVQLALAVMQ